MSSPYRIIQVTDMQDPKATQAIDVLMKAFEHDPVANGVVGGKAALKHLTYSTVVRATILAGQLHVAVGADDSVVGTACWYPPGTDFLADERQQEQGAKELFRLLQEQDLPLFKWWTETFIPSLGGFANRHMDAAPGENVKTSNWTLYSLSVHPDHQGKGISRLLVKAGEDQARAQNLRTIFEASEDKNVAIYKRLGYEEKGLEHVDGPPGLPGYNMHLMVKTPV